MRPAHAHPEVGFLQHIAQRSQALVKYLVPVGKKQQFWPAVAVGPAIIFIIQRGYYGFAGAGGGNNNVFKALAVFALYLERFKDVTAGQELPSFRRSDYPTLRRLKILNLPSEEGFWGLFGAAVMLQDGTKPPTLLAA